MSELALRLARLRGQAGLSPARPSSLPALKLDTAPITPSLSSHGVAPADHALRDSLRRLAGLRDRAIGRVERGSRDVPGEEIAPGLRYLERRHSGSAVPENFDLAFARMDSAQRSHVLAFDTETTGLAGGTGTRAFMIGAAHWEEDELCVRQLYLTAMSGEAAMLRAFAGWIEPSTVLLSYNGKSYDAPLLATRYRLARMANPLPGLAHVDLLHPMRRRYRHVWENCRLATAERKLLDVLREDDLPGSEAPRAWLSYLRGGASTNLKRVAEHNRQDLLSLAGLLVTAHGWSVEQSLHAGSGTIGRSQEHAMAEREKPKRESGYAETNPKPRPADGSKVPGTGSPHEHQNMPKDKPGKR
ncbi:ribonuclease H-like domain-containing protein [Pinirhizobacter sp.]|jgi:hypothetical protein|uniref:ribonuclease H-like domain-containing protein n=1 Tax=Pinirhizobacter sp. TaxID=2950432 RepID=UPI002F3F36C7